MKNSLEPEIRQNGHTITPPLNIQRIIEDAFIFLEENASHFIKDIPENQSFIAHPDDPAEHKPKWHQFGIITHTRKFADQYERVLHHYIKEWGVEKVVNDYLNTTIDGISKKDLLRMSIPFHDVGKFAGRFFEMENGKSSAHFNGHEALSETLIRENENIQHFFISHGLSDLQIDYIARCAGLHYELGKIKKTLKNKGVDFTIAFTKSQDCKDYCLASMEEHPDFKVEMGVLFLCDSLAKTDIILDACSDEEIATQSEKVAKMVAEQGLHPKLADAIKQVPVNIGFARIYLGLIPEQL